MRFWGIVTAIAALTVLFPFPEHGPTSDAIAWWIPWAVTGGLSLLKGINNKKQQSKAPEYPIPPALQDFLKTGQLPMQSAPPITSTSMGSSNSNTISSGLEERDLVSTSESAPFITPEYGNLGGMVRQFAEQRLGSPSALPRGYIGQGIRAINDTFAPINRSIENKLVTMGRPPGSAAALAGAETRRGSQIADFLASVPMLERQMRDEDLAMASNILAQYGKGTRGVQTERGTIRTSGRSSTSGTTSGTTTEDGRQMPAIDPMMWLSLINGLNPQKGQGGGILDSLIGLLGMGLGTGAFGRKPATGA